MRITKEVLNAQAEMLNRLTNRGEGERYYIGYENGYTNLFLEVGNGRRTISYGNTKRELSEKINLITTILVTEENR